MFHMKQSAEWRLDLRGQQPQAETTASMRLEKEVLTSYFLSSLFQREENLILHIIVTVK